MRQGLVVVVVGLLVGFAPGQEQEPDLAGELRDLRAALDQAILEADRLGAERHAILEQARDSSPALETMIATLSDSSFATSVRSGADPIRIFGDFRVRLGYTQDRDFGNQDNGIASPVQALLGVGGGPEEDDKGIWLQAHFLVGLDFHLSRRVMTRFSLQAQGLFDNGVAPAPSSGALGAAGGGAVAEGVAGGGGAGATGLLLAEVRLYEGFIQFEDFLGWKGLRFRTGRQEIVLGDEFIFGDNEFFGGETLDALRFTWERDGLAIDLIAAKMSAEETVNPTNHPYATAGDGFDDDELFALYLSWEPSGELGVDLYWVYWNGNGGRSTGSLGNAIPSRSTGDTLDEQGFLRGFFHTFGLRFSGLLGDLDYDLEAAWQTGSISGFVIDEVRGLAVELDLGWTLDRDTRTRIYLRGLYSEGAHGDVSGFIPLFPERHSYFDPENPRSGPRYGLMNIIPMDNVFSVQAGVAFEPAENWRLSAAVLWATHDADLRPFAAEEDDIGWEIDLMVDYRHSAETTIGLGLGLFLPDEGAPFLGGSFIGPTGRDEPTFLAYLDLRVLF